VKSWLKWAHERFEIVWLTSWHPEKIRTLLRVVYCEKFLINFSDPPVQCADWSTYSSKVQWLTQAIPKLQGRGWYWIDDEVKYFEKETTELNLPKDRCLQVSEKGAESLEELRDGLERLRYDEVAKALEKVTLPIPHT
jgi:hypothetical protein